MSFQKDPPTKKVRPLSPVIGLFMLLVVGALSYLAAPIIIDWMATTQLSVGTFGWELLPFVFPAEWPEIAAQLVVTFILFLIIFTIVMVFLFLFMRPPRDEADVEMQKLRAEKNKMKQRR